MCSRAPFLVLLALVASACTRAPAPRPFVAPLVAHPLPQPASTSPPAVAPTSVTEAPKPPPPVPPPTKPRLYGIGRVAWVYDKPNGASRKLGYVGEGLSVELRDAAPRNAGEGCSGGFLPVQPRGFVCANQNVSIDPEHPRVRAFAAAQPVDHAYPFRYALSLGAPMYNRIPDDSTHRAVMMRYPPPRDLADWAQYFEDLVDDAAAGSVDPPPSFVLDDSQSPNPRGSYVRKSIPHGSMLAFTRMFEHQGRTWLLAADLSIVPAERFRFYRPTAFQGVELGPGIYPPFGWICGTAHPRYHRTDDGKFVQSGDKLPLHEVVRLTQTSGRSGKLSFRQTRDPAWWVRTDHLCELKLIEKLPDGVGPSDRWIYLSTIQQTLVAYEGLRPVYATLHASGRGGVHRGKGDVRNYTTPIGAFHINWKERFATFSPDKGAPTTFWIDNVMWPQYFEQPYALHGAYWHERFGQPTSAGCPNLAPVDAAWLFRFTEPELPEGWQAVAPERGQRGTLVVVGA